MATATVLILGLIYLIFPILILYACARIQWLDRIGAVVVTYITGLVLGNCGLLPDHVEKLQEGMMTVTIPLAIPLLLFSSDIRSWTRLAGKSILSLFIGTVMVVVLVVTGYLVFHTPQIPELWKISGMLVGVYTGGTPNLAALGMMLHVDPNTYIITHTYDLFAGSLYLFFLLTFAQRFFHLYLPAYSFSSKDAEQAARVASENAYAGIFHKKTMIPLLGGFALALLIFALGAISTLAVPKKNQMVVVVLIITSMGIIASLFPRIRRIPKTFELGMYFILVFSLVVSSMANIHRFSLESFPIMYYCAWVIFGSLIFQSILAWLFRIDADTMIITSAALICSPPFVPVVAGALKNREVIIPGITIGIIGYAMGNYLGFMVAQYLSSW